MNTGGWVSVGGQTPQESQLPKAELSHFLLTSFTPVFSGVAKRIRMYVPGPLGVSCEFLLPSS